MRQHLHMDLQAKASRAKVMRERRVFTHEIDTGEPIAATAGTVGDDGISFRSRTIAVR